jgi:hypothetical protein
MSITFNNLCEHNVPIENFGLKWRFTDGSFDRLPDNHLEQLKTLDKEAAKFLWDYITEKELHKDIPFKKDFFKTVESFSILDDNEREIKTWLYGFGIPIDKPVFLSWDKENVIIAPWEILIKYIGSFYFNSSDDLTVFDQNLDWAVLFCHFDEIYFGTNEDFKVH